jgi:antitoxin (DNA-binding transcriptional repressor) of toxin-antitoxin stability system
MTTKTIEIAGSQANLAELVPLVSAGTEVVLTNEGVPVARVFPIGAGEPQSRIAGLHPDAIETSEDFDAPLPDNFWLGKA